MDTKQIESYIQGKIQEYYRDLSSCRNLLVGKYYDGQSVMTYQDILVLGAHAIHEKFCSLSFQNLQVQPIGINIQPVLDGKYMIFVFGQLRDGTDNPVPFSDCFLMSPVGQDLRIANHIFKITTQI
ncbi:hypothetical protein HZS_349 [Henneguya salminicola]|nr:hypothetical protein HZS_349 [Henneguya salminicola]